MDIKILENLFQVTIDRWNLRIRHHQVIPKEDYGRSWTSQEWKSGAAEHDRSGKPEKILGIHCKKLTIIVKNLFSAEMRIPQGTERRFTMDRRKPETVHHQEQAYSENFVMGSDAAECVNKVKDQVRNRQERMSNVAESGDEHSII